jgi:hypothetical protein
MSTATITEPSIETSTATDRLTEALDEGFPNEVPRLFLVHDRRLVRYRPLPSATIDRETL